MRYPIGLVLCLATPNCFATTTLDAQAVVDSPTACGAPSPLCRLQSSDYGVDVPSVTTTAFDGINSADSTVASNGTSTLSTHDAAWSNDNYVSFATGNWSLVTTSTGGPVSFDISWDLNFSNSHGAADWGSLPDNGMMLGGGSASRGILSEVLLDMHVNAYDGDIAVLSWDNFAYMNLNGDQFIDTVTSGLAPAYVFSGIDAQHAYHWATGSNTYDLGIIDSGLSVYVSYGITAISQARLDSYSASSSINGSFTLSNIQGVTTPSPVPLLPGAVFFGSGLTSLLIAGRSSSRSNH